MCLVFNFNSHIRMALLIFEVLQVNKQKNDNLSWFYSHKNTYIYKHVYILTF